VVPPGAFWGKLARDKDGRIVAWLSVADHSADVAACCEVLLQRTLLRRRLATLGGLTDLGPRQVARLSVLAALHDLGKFSIGFQNKAGGPEAQFTCWS
jgi:CRISPR-associated endonuclease/helicase Cas3